MKISAYLKKFIIAYFIIFALIVIGITVLRQIFAPDTYFELKDIYIYMICALVGDLPSFILYSSREISEKERRLRIIVHFVVLEAALLILANVMGWVIGLLSSSLLAFQIAVIYVLVRFLSWRDDRKDALRINQMLKALKEESEQEST